MKQNLKSRKQISECYNEVYSILVLLLLLLLLLFIIY